MAARKQEGVVKVKANYPAISESICLWGVVFILIDGDYIAEVDSADADEMVAAGRVELV